MGKCLISQKSWIFHKAKLLYAVIAIFMIVQCTAFAVYDGEFRMLDMEWGLSVSEFNHQLGIAIYGENSKELNTQSVEGHILYFDENSDDFWGVALYGGLITTHDLPKDVLIAGYPVSYITTKSLYGYDGIHVLKNPSSCRVISAKYSFLVRDISDPEDAFCDLREKLVQLYGDSDYSIDSEDSIRIIWTSSKDTCMELCAHRKDSKVYLLNIEYGISNAELIIEEMNNPGYKRSSDNTGL